tara:strand:+ start:16 stop:438 length:423 start_codon:yes stop_codon:yes gene_type:complete
MSIRKILNSLECSWERNDILLKIKNGLSSDEIVNEFLIKNELQVKELNSLLKPNDIDLLNQVEKLSTCEAKLINRINNFNNVRDKDINYTIRTINEKKISFSNKVPANKISMFMINWSNKFVVIALITISAIALSKQAWA